MMIDFSELEDDINDWEDKVECIAHGWGNIDEYRFYLESRDCLQQRLDQLVASGEEIPNNFLEQITRIDQHYIDVTVESDICAEFSHETFQQRSDGRMERVVVSFSDKERYWYFYRWPPNCPYVLQDGGDSI